MKNTVILSVVALGLSLCALHPLQAVTPPPDGGYPGGNTAEGDDALLSLTYGTSNTAVGFEALYNNTGGTNNTAIGVEALRNNLTGYSNTAVGLNALVSNRSGRNNTATGLSSLLNNTGHGNTAMGYAALLNNTIGGKNIAVGSQAGGNLTSGSYNIDIGNPGVAGESNTIRIGKTGDQTATYVAGIRGAAVPGGVTVVVDTDGHLGTVVSSARFKDKIQPMDRASEAILALKPVTFRYKHELDPAGIPQFGLVAEQVEKVNPDLVARDEQGKPYTVRYEAVNAMLLNEFLKEHRKVETLETSLAQLQSIVKSQAAQLQKVQDQIQASKPVLRVVSSGDLAAPCPSR